MNDTIKGALKSKTMWLNGLAAVATVTDQLANAGGLITALGGGPAVVAGITVANMVLRAVTTTSLAEKS